MAAGDLYQVPHGNRITARLVFRFRDGSLQEETAVFSQQKQFKLVSDHLVQKGPAFKQPMDVFIDVAKGDVKVQTIEDGKEKTYAEHMEMPDDLADGLVMVLMKNVPLDAPKATFSMIVATPKPRLVKLVITPIAKETFTIAGARRKAMHYLIKLEIGGSIWRVELVGPLWPL